MENHTGTAIMNVSFISCTQSEFISASGSYSAGALYFVTDTGVLYRATSSSNTELYGGGVKVVASEPATPQQGILYVVTSDGSEPVCKAYTGSSWTTLFKASSTTVTSGSTDSTLATSKSVYDFVTGLTTNSGGTSSESGKIPLLNASGKLNSDVLPAFALSEYKGEVSSFAGLITLSTAEKGDWAKVAGSTTASENGSYILNGTYSNQADWVRLADALDEISIDASPTFNSSNAVSSGGVYTALQGKLNSPDGNGSSGQILQTDGEGATYWVNAPSGGTTLEWGTLST